MSDVKSQREPVPQPERLTTPEKAEAADGNTENAHETLIGRTIRLATKYQKMILVYVASAAATVVGLSYLKYKGNELDLVELCVALVVTVLPLVATFFALTLPQWRTRRRTQRLIHWSLEGHDSEPGYFRIGPYEDIPPDQERFSRADGAHESVLRWLSAPSQPLLFLTGASGAGKTSLLNAWVIPHLREADSPARIITLRGFDDPLCLLRSHILTEGVVWSKPPKSAADEPVADLLRRACSHLKESSCRVVLVFDQFEEFLILHEGDTEALKPVRDFLDAVVRMAFPGLTVLVTLRTEYEGMLSSLGVPPLQQGRNWMKVNPFSERDAREFLKKGFNRIGDDLLDAIMAEAAAIEGTRGLVRPITLNMLGAVLARSADNKELRAARGRLLSADLEGLLETPDIRNHARDILAPMLTDAGTKRPRSIGELEGATGVQAEAVEGCLLHLASSGLVRRLNRSSDLRERIWEVSHDFVARLMENVLRRPRRRLWALTRSVALAAAFLLWLATFGYLLPDYLARAQQRTISRLTSEFGLSVKWDDAVAGYHVVAADKEFSRLSEAGPLLCRLGKVESLDLSDCKTLPSLEGLGGITGLKTLDVRNCQSLRNLNGLQSVATLQKLKLGNCTGLRALDALKDLNDLRELDLQACGALTSLNVLQGMTRLETLTFFGARSLTSLEGVEGLTSLKLFFIGSGDLRSLKGVERLTRLEGLLIVGCERLTDLDDVRGLPNVNALAVLSCRGLTSLGGLQGLGNLRQLSLRDCTALTGLDGLKGLASLETLSLVDCARLSNLDPVRGLTNLRVLDLTGCSALTSVDQLQGLKNLRELRLTNCHGLKTVTTLRGLPGLTTLDVRGCRGLASLDGLQGLKSLRDLDLRWMAPRGLEFVVALPSLERLGISPEMVTPRELTSVKEKLPTVTLVTGWYEPGIGWVGPAMEAWGPTLRIQYDPFAPTR